MRRADRLFRIVQLLRHGRLLTAARLAEKLEVSTRTIYRDVVDLQLSGMPIEGEAGIGYTLRRDFDLPPLMFTSAELTALVLGARLVQAWGGAESVKAAGSALQRIEAVLPAELRDRLGAIQMYAPGFQMPAGDRERLDQLHSAILAVRCVDFSYTRKMGRRRNAGSARWVCSSGRVCGRWWHGASYATVFAPSGLIGLATSPSLRQSIRPGPGNRWQTICRLSRPRILLRNLRGQWSAMQ